MISASFGRVPLVGDDPALRRFVSERMNRDGAFHGGLHLGDLVWGAFLDDLRAVERRREKATWADAAGEPRGLAWLEADGEALLNLDPALPGSAYWVLMDAMLAWADERHAARSIDAPLALPWLASDAITIAGLAERGFVRTTDPDAVEMLLFRRDLATIADGPPLPPGWTVRPTREDELAERAAIHREVWEPSKLTDSAYAHLRTHPVFDPELDLVAAHDTGRLGAYATCWWDPIAGTGELEPVGARVADRRQGLAAAVLREGLRRLRARGARSALVYTTTDRIPAWRLYESVGFQVIDHWVTLTRR